MFNSLRIPGVRRVNWYPQLNPVSVKRIEARRHDPHHRGNNTVNIEKLSQYIGVAVEFALPKRITDDDSLRRVLHLLRQEYPSHNRPDAENAEEARSGILHVNCFRLPQAGQSGPRGTTG